MNGMRCRFYLPTRSLHRMLTGIEAADAARAIDKGVSAEKNHA
jgi:hypothetical protein